MSRTLEPVFSFKDTFSNAVYNVPSSEIETFRKNQLRVAFKKDSGEEYQVPSWDTERFISFNPTAKRGKIINSLMPVNVWEVNGKRENVDYDKSDQFLSKHKDDEKPHKVHQYVYHRPDGKKVYVEPKYDPENMMTEDDVTYEDESMLRNLGINVANTVSTATFKSIGLVTKAAGWGTAIAAKVIAGGEAPIGQAETSRLWKLSNTLFTAGEEVSKQEAPFRVNHDFADQSLIGKILRTAGSATDEVAVEAGTMLITAGVASSVAKGLGFATKGAIKLASKPVAKVAGVVNRVAPTLRPGALSAVGSKIATTKAGKAVSKLAKTKVGKAIIKGAVKPSALSVTYGGASAADAYNEAKKAGIEHDTAFTSANAVGAINMMVETASQFFGAQASMKSVLDPQELLQSGAKRVLVNMMSEGGEEAIQGFSESMIMNHIDAREEDWTQIAQNAMMDFFWGSAMSGVFEGTGALRKVVSQSLAARRDKSNDKPQLIAGCIVHKDGSIVTPGRIVIDSTTGKAVSIAGLDAENDVVRNNVDAQGETVEATEMDYTPAEKAAYQIQSFFNAQKVAHAPDKLGVTPIVVSTEDLVLNDRIQSVKEADSPSGVIGAFDQSKASPIVVMQFKDGHTEVVSGRNRITAAKEAKEITIDAQLIREVDGWTVEQARVLDAYLNLKEESGTDTDRVSFFENVLNKIPKGSLEQSELLKGKNLQAYNLVQHGGSAIMDAFRSRKISLDRASAIADALPKQIGQQAEALQTEIFKTAQAKHYTNEEANLFAASVSAIFVSRFARDQHGFLLEGSDVRLLNPKQMKVLTKEFDIIRRHIAQTKRDKYAAKGAKYRLEKGKVMLTKKEAKLFGSKVGSVNEADLDKIIDIADKAITKWKRFYYDYGTMKQVREEVRALEAQDPYTVFYHGDALTREQLRDTDTELINATNAEAEQEEVTRADEARQKEQGEVPKHIADTFPSTSPGLVASEKDASGTMTWTMKIMSDETMTQHVTLGDVGMDLEFVSGSNEILITKIEENGLVNADLVNELATQYAGFEIKITPDIDRRSEALNAMVYLNATDQTVQFGNEVMMPSANLTGKMIGDQIKIVEGAGRVIMNDTFANRSPAMLAPRADGPEIGGITPRAFTQEAMVAFYGRLKGNNALPKILKRLQHNSWLGGYSVDKNEVSLRSSIFGLLDESDVNYVRSKLRAKGFFLHEGSEWRIKQPKHVVEGMRIQSEKAFKEMITELINKKTDTERGNALAVATLAHEIGHLVDFIDGKTEGTLINHLLALKKKVQQTINIAGQNVHNKIIVKEAFQLIAHWRNMDVDSIEQKLGKKPNELFAELFSVFLVNPAMMAERAPMTYDTLIKGINASGMTSKYLDICEEISGKDTIRGAFSRIRETWQKSKEVDFRKFMQRIKNIDFKDHLGATFIFSFIDRKGPIVMEARRAKKYQLKELKKKLKAEGIREEDYVSQEEIIEARFDELKEAVEQARHQGSKSKLIANEVAGQVMGTLHDADLEWEDLQAYAHLHRVLELEGRATAAGLTPGGARELIEEMKADLGAERYSQLDQAWNNFRAIYEHYVIENPKVIAMLSPKTIELMKKYPHYVTMEHRLSPEEMDTYMKERQKWQEERGNIPFPLDIVNALQYGKTTAFKTDQAHWDIHTLEGSMSLTNDPLAATIKTALRIIRTAEDNYAKLIMANYMLKSGYTSILQAQTQNGQVVSINNNRTSTVLYNEEGLNKGLYVPRIVADAFDKPPNNLGRIAYCNRFITSFFTTNNLGFMPVAYERDLAASAYLNKGLYRSGLTPLTQLLKIVPRQLPLLGGILNSAGTAVAGVAPMLMRYIPPTVMDKIATNPIGRLILNQHTVEYWSSMGYRMAKMVQEGTIEETMLEALEAYEQGNKALGDKLSLMVYLVKEGLNGGIVMNDNQVTHTVDNRSHIDDMFRKFGIEIGNRLDHFEGMNFLKRNYYKALAVAQKVPDIGEVNEMTTRFAVYAWMRWKQGDAVGQTDSYGNPITFGDDIASPNKGVKEGAKMQSQAQINVAAMKLAGSPNFTERGYYVSFIELALGPYLSAKKTGFVRTVNAMVDHPGDFFLKQALYTMPALMMSYFIGNGLVSALMRESFKEGDDDDDDDEIENRIRHSKLAPLYETMLWMETATRNYTPYERLKYDLIPIALFGENQELTLSISIPRGDEAILLASAFDVLMQKTLPDMGGFSTRMDVSNLDTVVEAWKGFMPSFQGASPVLSLFRMVAEPILFNENPYDPFMGRPMYDEKTFLAKWHAPDFALEAFKKSWNFSPLVAINRMDTRKPNEAENSLSATIKLMRNTPVIGSVINRWLRVSVHGVSATRASMKNYEAGKMASIELEAESIVAEWRKEIVRHNRYHTSKDPDDHILEKHAAFIDAYPQLYNGMHSKAYADKKLDRMESSYAQQEKLEKFNLSDEAEKLNLNDDRMNRSRVSFERFGLHHK